jgi:Tfp pilus assembly protein PilN
MTHVTTGIEILASKIRIVQLKTSGKQSFVTHWGEIVFQPDDRSDEKISTLLREHIARHHLKIAHAIISLPRHEITVRSLTLPTLDSNEIKKMLSYEVARLVPFSAEDVVIDFQCLSTDEKGYSNINAVIVQRARIQRYIDICQAAGFEPADFQIRTSALANLVSFKNAQISATDSDDNARHAYTLLSVEEDLLEIARIEDTNMVFSRGVELPRKDEHLLVAEIIKTKDFYEKECGGSLFDSAVMSGDPNLLSALRETFQPMRESAIQLSPSDVLQIKPSKGSESPDLAFDSRFSVSAGLALHNCPTSLFRYDLLPGELKERKARKALRDWTLIVSGLFVAVVLLTYFNAWALFTIKENRIKQLQREIASLKALGDEIKTMRSKIMVIREQMDMRNSPLEILSEVIRITPADVSLNSFHLDVGGKLTLGGETIEFSIPYRYVSILENSERFNNVTTQYVTRKRIGDQETVIFKISCDVVPAEEKAK